MIDSGIASEYTTYQMECFNIEWKGYFPFKDAFSKLEAREIGVYAVYRVEWGDKQLLYVGKAGISQTIADRLMQHRQGTKRFMSNQEEDKLSVCFGIIRTFEGSNIVSQQLNDVESFLIYYGKPQTNARGKERYKGKPLIIVNTGERGSFDKVISTHTTAIELLKKNLCSW